MKTLRLFVWCILFVLTLAAAGMTLSYLVEGQYGPMGIGLLVTIILALLLKGAGKGLWTSCK